MEGGTERGGKSWLPFLIHWVCKKISLVWNIWRTRGYLNTELKRQILAIKQSINQVDACCSISGSWSLGSEWRPPHQEENAGFRSRWPHLHPEDLTPTGPVKEEAPRAGRKATAREGGKGKTVLSVEPRLEFHKGGGGNSIKSSREIKEEKSRQSSLSLAMRQPLGRWGRVRSVWWRWKGEWEKVMLKKAWTQSKHCYERRVDGG